MYLIVVVFLTFSFVSLVVSLPSCFSSVLLHPHFRHY